MTRKYHCSECKIRHQRPVAPRCTRNKTMDSEHPRGPTSPTGGTDGALSAELDGGLQEDVESSLRGERERMAAALDELSQLPPGAVLGTGARMRTSATIQPPASFPTPLSAMNAHPTIDVSAGLMTASASGAFNMPQQGIYTGGMFLPQQQMAQVPQSMYQAYSQPLWQPMQVMQQQATLPLQQHQLGTQMFQQQQQQAPAQVYAQPPPQAQAAASTQGPSMTEIQSLIATSITQAMGEMSKKLDARDTEGAIGRGRNKDKNTTRERNSRDRRETRERRERERADNTDEEVELAMRELGLNRDASSNGSGSSASSSASEGEDNSKENKEKKKKKGKSGRDLTTEDGMDPLTPWPQLRVFEGDYRRGPKYDQLSLPEFIDGFLGQAKRHRHKANRRHMYNYLRELMIDLEDRADEWNDIRSCHAVFLTRLERKEVSWTSESKIAKMKNRYIYSAKPLSMANNLANAATTTSNSASREADRVGTASASSKPDRPVNVCARYQHGECTREDGHQGYLHICANCFRNKGRQHRHPECECYAIHGVPNRRKFGGKY